MAKSSKIAADARRRAMLERESSRACNGANVFAVAILAVVVASARIAWLEHARMGGWAEIPVLPASLPVADFERDYVGKLLPVILRGTPNPFGSGWSLSRLADACGDGGGLYLFGSTDSLDGGALRANSAERRGGAGVRIHRALARPLLCAQSHPPPARPHHVRRRGGAPPVR